MKKTLPLALALGAAVLLCACSSSSTESTTAAAPAGTEAAAEESGIYTPGTYSGEADGFGGTVMVTITTDASSITDVTVSGDDETPSVGGAALDELADAIMEAQSADIDTVSGATITSDGVIAAAKEAIDMAKGSAPESAEG